MVGGDYIERDLKAAALEGRIVQIAFLKGAKVELDLMRLMLRRLTLTGSTLRIQSTEAKARMAKAIEQRIWPLVAAGKLKPVIDSTFPLKDAAKRTAASTHRTISAKSCWCEVGIVLRDGLRPSSGYGRRPHGEERRASRTMRPKFPPRQGNPQLPNRASPLI